MTTTLIILSWIALGLVNVYLYGVSDRRNNLGWTRTDSAFILLMFLVVPMFTIVLLFQLIPSIGIFNKIYNMGNKK